MIIVEDIIKARVSKLTKVDLLDGRSQLPVYGWGDKNELNKYLKEVGTNSYPLIWQIPTKENESVNQITQRSEFIIAVNFVKEDTELMNSDRLELTFKPILMPLLEDFIDVVNKGKNSSFDKSNYERFKIPNYSVTNRENDVVDLWDAVTLSIDATYFNNC